MTPPHSALHSAAYTLGRSWRISGSIEESYEGMKRLGITWTSARTRDPHRTHQHSRCYRLAAGTEREVYPRDHVVTIGLRNTLYGELAARDLPLCALTSPRTHSVAG